MDNLKNDRRLKNKTAEQDVIGLNVIKTRSSNGTWYFQYQYLQIQNKL